MKTIKASSKKGKSKSLKRKNHSKNRRCLVVSEICSNNQQQTHELLSDWEGAS